ncbi:MAG: hypothetical protein KDC98_09685, partial [Planctomycetes bacterium]|nr:hypothetical protein [Planctomycetota bacterium]
LQGHEPILAAARRTGAAFESGLDPLIVQKRDIIRSKITQHRAVAPTAQSTQFEADLAALVARDYDDVNRRVSELDELGMRVAEEVVTYLDWQAEAERLLPVVDDLLRRLAAAGIPAAEYGHLLQAVEQVRAGALPERDFHRAMEILQGCEATCNGLLEQARATAAQWSEQSRRIEKIKAFAAGIKRAMPIFHDATRVLDQAATVEQAQQRGDLGAAFAGLEVLEDRYRLLQASVTAASGEGGSIGAVSAAWTETRDALQAKQESIEGKLRRLSASLEAEIADQKTAEHRRLPAITRPLWTLLQRPTADYGDELATARDRVLGELDDLGAHLDELLSNPQQLEAFAAGARQEAEVAARSDRPQRIADLLAELRRFKVDVAIETRAFEELQAIPAEAVDAGVDGRMLRLERSLVARLAEARTAHAAKMVAARQKIDRIDENIKRFARANRDHQPYVDSLQAQCDDLKALVASGDPEMYALAVSESVDLVRKMIAIDPDRRAKDSKTFADVEKVIKTLSNKLGKGDVVRKRMATTYQVLYAALQDAIVRARAASPDDGLAILAALEPDIDKACTDAAQADLEWTAFEERKKAIATRWGNLKSTTRTRMTDRAVGFAARLESRLAAATEEAGEEGKMDKALALLQQIQADFDAIEIADDPRRALQDMDAAAMAEMRKVEDLARWFERARDTFEKVTIADLRKALKGKKGVDTDQLDSLGKVGQQATTMVRPYLDIISSLPHRNLMANKAPDLAKATADFARAQQMLRDATRLAANMASGEGTNVGYAGDIERIAAEWPKATHAYGAAIGAMADAIEAAAADDDGPARQAAANAKARLQALTRHFDPSAFARPAQDLAGDAAADKKLPARENGMRLVHRYKRDILEHPLMVKCNASDNPFRKLNRETGLLRATLKKLELELLGGI